MRKFTQTDRFTWCQEAKPRKSPANSLQKRSSIIRRLGLGTGITQYAMLLTGVTALSFAVTYSHAADKFVPGSLKRELFPNQLRAAVENGTAGAPSQVDFLTSFQTLDFSDNYSQRISGVFIPPTTGDYVFFVSSDDDSDLFLSTDASPANKRLIAQETAWSGARAWTSSPGGSNIAQKRSDQFRPAGAANPPFATGIRLTAGQQYYIEGVHHEGGGGDNFGVTYMLLNTDAEPTDGDETRLTGNVIAAVIKEPTQLTFTTQPQNSTAIEGASVRLSAAVQTDTDLTPKYQWRRNGTIIAGATGANYSFIAGANDNNAKYDVVVSFDNLTNTVTSSQATLTVQPGTTVTGALRNQLWDGATRAQVEGGSVGTPTFVSVLNSFESPVNQRDNYSRRISGYFTPATTGNYVFFISADDDADLFLSTDANPSNKRLIAQETIWSAARSWTTSGGSSDLVLKRSDTFTPDQGATTPFANGIPLQAGQKYYIEGVQHEGSGGDSLEATFKLVGEADPVDGDPSKLTGNLISFSTPAVTAFAITNQVQNVTTNEALNAQFRIGVNTDSEITPVYQWRRNGTNIAGATSPTYSFTTAQTDNNAQFDVVISLPHDPSRTLTSSVARLTVISSTLVTGQLKREFFPNQTRTAVLDGTAGEPTVTDFVNSFDIGSRGDNYAQRVSGFFIPPTTGRYVFFLAADDDTDLFLSTDDKPATKRLIAQETVWSAQRNWITPGGGTAEQKRSDAFSPDQGTTFPFAEGIQLTAGQRYYIEAVHHEGSGGDSVGVTFKLLADADPVDGEATKMVGNTIAALLPKPNELQFSSQPQSQSVAVGAPLTLTATVQTDSLVAPVFQWRKNGVALTNNTGGRVLSKIATPDDIGATYDVVVTLPGFTNTVTSSAAAITAATGQVVTGSLRRQFYSDSTTRPQVEAGLVPVVPVESLITSFEAPTDAADNYAQRVSGFFIPQTTGDYVFFLSADDDADLFLSTDESPANKRLIAQETAWSPVRSWVSSPGSVDTFTQKRSDQWTPSAGAAAPYAAGIRLESGKRYYIEAVQREGGSGDNLAVTFKLASEPDPVDGDATRITSGLIAYVQGGGSSTNNPGGALSVARSGAGLTITWTGGGTLQTTTDIGNPASWTDVTGGSPLTVTPSDQRRFYRLKP